MPEPSRLYGDWGLIRLRELSANTSIDRSGLYGLAVFVIIDDDPRQRP